MLVLGIESTCDETSAAVVRDGREILSNVVASQVELHRSYGGVVPELACRRHVNALFPVIDRALEEANVTLSQIDRIAVAQGPGLIGALFIGLNGAKALSLSAGIPLVGVNHIEAHLYAAMMSHPQEICYPCLGVVLSGGHTALVKIHSIGNYELIGQTHDDAIGEAFDKVAKILELPYPGGPQIEQLAQKGSASYYPLKMGQIKGRPYDFSFSGIKTGVLYTVKGQNFKRDHTPLNEQERCHLAASFQERAFMDVIKKIGLCVKEENFQSLLFGGGVTCNRHLRSLVKTHLPEVTAIWPELQLTLDNAAMIAGLGYHRIPVPRDSLKAMARMAICA